LTKRASGKPKWKLTIRGRAACTASKIASPKGKWLSVTSGTSPRSSSMKNGASSARARAAFCSSASESIPGAAWAKKFMFTARLVAARVAVWVAWNCSGDITAQPIDPHGFFS
jgi:hypothetical protein